DHDARPLLADQLAQFGPCRLEGCEGTFARGRIVDTGHALVFAKVDSKNGFRGRGCRNRVHRASSSWGWWGLFAWQLSDYHAPTACMDSFGGFMRDARMTRDES